MKHYGKVEKYINRLYETKKTYFVLVNEKKHILNHFMYKMYINYIYKLIK